MIAGLYCWDHSELKQTFSLIQYGFLMLFAFILWYLNWNFPTNIQKSLWKIIYVPQLPFFSILNNRHEVNNLGRWKEKNSPTAITLHSGDSKEYKIVRKYDFLLLIIWVLFEWYNAPVPYLYNQLFNHMVKIFSTWKST